MSFRAVVYNVMIASPSDVAAERNAVRQVLEEWNAVHGERRQIVLMPLAWETHSTPEMGDHPQSILNTQILEKGDLLVGVFWTRVGTPTERHASGSVEEIEEHIALGKPAMLYFSNQPVRLDSVDPTQYQQLTEFKNSCRTRGLLEEYNDLADFRSTFYRQLQLRLNDDQYFHAVDAMEGLDRIVDASARPAYTLSPEAQGLLKAAVGEDGIVVRVAYGMGTTIGTTSRNFIETQDRRELARWEAAIEQLERAKLVEDKAGKGELYFVTNEGYRVGDGLPPTAVLAE